jgi:HK97 family phage portal protein
MANLLRRRTKEFSSKREAAEASRIQDRKEHSYIEQRLKIPISRLGDINSFLSVGSKKVWASFRACHLVASLIMSTEFKLVKPDQPEWKPKPGDPQDDFLSNPNPFDSWKEMLYLWTFHMKLTGRAYWMKDEINGMGQPSAVYPMLPQYMKIVPDAKKGIGMFIYSVNGKEISLTPEEVIYFRRPSAISLIEGMGDVEPSQDLYNDFINRSTYSEKFIEHGAQPSGILTLKEPMDDEEQWGKLKDWWNREYSGKQNAGKTAFLSGEWSYQQLGLTHQEMQAVERDTMTVNQIFMNHGVPLSIAGIQGAANYATARVDEMNFRKYEIVPLLELFIGKLNRSGALFTNFEESTQIAYNLSGLIDVEQVTRDYGPLVSMGAMTLNEYREKAGLPKIDNPYLDQFFIPSSFTPLEMAGLTDVPPAEATVKRLVREAMGR